MNKNLSVLPFATCKVCGREWQPRKDQQREFCSGCWDEALTYFLDRDDDLAREHIADSADRTNRTERTVRQHFNVLLEAVAADEAAKVSARRRRRGERYSWCGTR